MALLVAAVGLLSVMSLFPVGMDLSKKAIDEAQAALFSEEIFNGFRAKMGLPGTPWSDLDSLVIKAPAPDMWVDGDSQTFRANSSGTNVYAYKYESTMLDYAVRWVMNVEDLPARPGIKYMRLTLWNGQYGSTTNPLVFYTELFNPGQ